MKAKKQKILYKKIQVDSLEKDVSCFLKDKIKKLYVSKEKKIYFLEAKKRVYLYDLTEDIVNIPGLGFSADLHGDNLIVSIEIDSNKIDKLFSDPIKIKSRKKMVLLFQKCIEQAKKEYLNSIQLGMMYSACKKKKIKQDLDRNIMFKFHEGNLEWMKQMEKNSEKINYIFPSDYIKVGSSFVDTKTGKIQDTINKIPVRFRGGVLVNDIDNHWMYDILNLKRVSKGGKIKQDYFNTNATLILSSNDNTYIWEKTITSFNKGYVDVLGKSENKKYRIVRSKKDHDKLTYKDTLDLDYLVVSMDYITSEDYYELFEDYVVSENTPIEEIIECMRADYIKCEKKVKKYTNPIFSLFYWNRMLIDDYSINKMDSSKRILDSVFSIESFYKWIQINNVPSNLDKLMMCINYLIKYKKVNLPLYDDNYNMVYLGDIIRFNLEPHSSSLEQLKIEELKINLDMDKYQKTVYNYFVEYSNDKLDSRFNLVLMDTINEMSLSSKPPKEGIVLDACCICYDDLNEENSVETKCGHFYCIDCSLKSIRFTDSCAYCRKQLEPSDYSKLTYNKNSKLGVLESDIPDNSKNIVICNSSKIGWSLSNYKNSWHSLDDGPIMETINRFNNEDTGTLFIDTDNLHQVSNLTNLDNIVIFDRIEEDSKCHFANPNIFRNMAKAKVIYLIYNGTKEEF